MEDRHIVIVGSYNVGLFFKGDTLPGTGETVIFDAFTEGGGGKGSNQAIACSKLGGTVCLVARIGQDKYGQDALAMYDRYGISCRGIRVDETIHTGVSVILIDRNGRNMICVVPGANFNLSREDIDRNRDLLEDAYLVGFQLENNLDVVAYGIRQARQAGALTLLDPAPARKLPDDLLPFIDIIKPNEHEASLITGLPVTGVDEATLAGEWFLQRGVGTAIITLGEHGCVLVREGKAEHFPAPRVDVADTTGAGDCFSGALMAALSRGADYTDAIRFANRAASMTCRITGVIEAIPDLADLADLADLPDLPETS